MAKRADQIFEFSSGVKFRAITVNSMLIYDAQEQFPFPDPPKFQVKMGGGSGQLVWVDNPDHPDYRRRVEDVERKRNMAALDVMILHGIELVDPVPAERGWLDKVAATVDLSRFEDGHGQVRETYLPYLYLRYVAIAGREDYELVAKAVVPTEEGVGEAMDQFPGNAE